MSYQHVLLVTDLLSDADIVAKKVKYIVANRPEIKLSILHIIEDNLGRFGYDMVPAFNLSDETDDEPLQGVRTKLAQFIERNKLEAVNSEVTVAISNSKGIVDYCHKNKVDLLVIGRHERHGVAAWLIGATSDSILPNVPCDSLVVKLDKPVPR